MQDESGLEKLKRKIVQEPLVPFGSLLTLTILMGGLRSFTKGGSAIQQQRFMRARVFAQGATLVALAFGAYQTSKNPPKFDADKYKGNSQSH